MVCGLGALLGVSRLEWALLAAAIASVWAAEALNTALEFACDAATPDPHPLVRKAKDVAAGGVLLCALGALAVGALVLGPRVWGLVR